ncbi:MAG: signal peptidase I [Pseudomonadota bacterium]|nr:signal peptidase I [Pseudomonadota bacterium]
MNVDFATALFLATVFTGGVWLIDHLFFAAERRARRQVGGASKVPEPAGDPILVEYCKAFFPVILVVFLLRSFLAEPFRIPSGSMIPTLEVGDFILVNKFAYGIRLPVINHKVIDLGAPRRGDVVVFRYPPDPGVDYIKRVVGLPGDRIGYYDKVLYINGKPVPMERLEERSPEGEPRQVVFSETLDGNAHRVQWIIGRPSPEGEIEVPEGQYFVLGDNRDNSRDSRVWGFVPDENLVGKAFIIWMSWNSERTWINFGRIGDIIH